MAEALNWFERELAWGVKEAELRHLTGRIGELYAAMITRGQMALETNQRGYDVVSAENERISVKTVTSSSHVTFKESTLHFVDRVMILRLNADRDEGVSIEAIFDKPIDEATAFLTKFDGGYRYMVSRANRVPKPLENLAELKSVSFDGYEIVQYENGTIQVLKGGLPTITAKPHLRVIAEKLGFPTHRVNGDEKNTRQMGSGIIQLLNQASEKRVFEALAKLGRVP